jgi:ubiquinone/menaquinone biosynthesis C-methylase UbiE
MVESKAWDWEKAEDTIWLQPSEDVYYYVELWKRKGFKDFLDLGCGLGRNALFFAQHGFQVSAIDLSQEGLDRLRMQASALRLDIAASLGDMHALPYADKSFDCLLAYHALSHTDSSGIRTILSEIKRVLKPEGEFYITLCSKESPSWTSGGYKKLDENTIVKDKAPETGIPHYYSNLPEVRAVLKDFTILSIRHIRDIFENDFGAHYFVYGRNGS